MFSLENFARYNKIPEKPREQKVPHNLFSWEWQRPQRILYYDWETVYDPANKVSLRNMKWAEYKEAILQNPQESTVAWGYLTGDGDVVDLEFRDAKQGFDDFFAAYNAAELTSAHNALFDARVTHQVYGQPWQRCICSLELAKRVWPGQPGPQKDGEGRVGPHSLKNLAQFIGNIPQKLEIDLANCTPEELREYNLGDVITGAKILHEELKFLAPEELLLAELSFASNALYAYVDPAKAREAQQGFLDVASEHVEKVVELLSSQNDDAHVSALNANKAKNKRETSLKTTLFGMDGGKPKSVRYQALKAVLAAELGFDTKTTSKKKLNPEVVRAAGPEASAVIENLSQVSGSIWHAQNTGKMGGRVDLNYRYSSAATGRPGGAGLGVAPWNALNVPKRNWRIANIVRPLFQFQEPVVAGDAANAEYRALGLITGCKHIVDLFSKDALADPYSEFCYVATGIRAGKGDVLRDVVFKQAVLSLLFMCGLANWINQILVCLANGEVTLDQLNDIARTNKWYRPSDNEWVDRAAQQTRAPEVVVAVCHHTYELFHKVHPELRMFAEWGMGTCERFAAALDGHHALQDRLRYPGAPDPEWCEFMVDPKPDEKSIIVRCGKWAPTVNWRRLEVRNCHNKFKGCDEPKLSMVHERLGYRAITKQIIVENVAQSLSRNMMSELKLRMWKKHGFTKCWDVYDEAKWHTTELRRCYEAMMSEVGPGSGGCGYGNFFVFHPEEVTYGMTMKGEEKPSEWWRSQE